jgi:NADPH-dependent ferric siderophore reductase
MSVVEVSASRATMGPARIRIPRPAASPSGLNEATCKLDRDYTKLLDRSYTIREANETVEELVSPVSWSSH